MSGAEYAARLAPRIQQILASSDRSTITAKKVRKQLIAEGEPESAVKEHKDDLTAVIEKIYHSVPLTDQPESEEDEKPLASTSTPARSSAGTHAAMPASSPAVPLYRPNGTGTTPKPKAKPKAKPSVARIDEDGDDSDEAFARALQAELDGLDGGRKRRTRDVKSKSTVSRVKKRKSAAILSDGESGDDTKRRRSGGNNAFMKEMLLDDALAAFVGKPRESRPQVVKRIWDHVKSNNLQDPQDRRQIMCDEQLRAVFGVDKMHMFTMNKLLSSHLFAPDDVVDGNGGNPKAESASLEHAG